MKMVGLTGGIGAGKSAVAARFATLGAVIVDSDRLAREVVAPGTPGLSAVVASFGPDILAADGSLDRAALAAQVFGDQAARERLEAIIHPLVRSASSALVAAAPPDAIVVNDVPLLVEKGMSGLYSVVVIVFASLETRLDRLVRLRGMTADEARARIAAQASDEQRRAVADISIVNDGTPEELTAAADAAWTRILATS